MKETVLTALLQPVVESLGYEHVGIEYVPQGRHSLVRVYIDQENGISVEDCEKVSRQVSAILDVEDPIQGQFTLEVSSPGLDRPLFTLAQFEQFQGNEVSIRLIAPLDNRRKFKGVIQGVADQTVKLEMDGAIIDIPFDAIDKANLVPVVKF